MNVGCISYLNVVVVQILHNDGSCINLKCGLTKWLTYLSNQVSLWEQFELLCKEKYWIFNKTDHGATLSILGQDKVT